ncbi:hypothetical protein [Carboxylicivirga marina]|uniref:Uncharacterized protein n=1 Tax=Carboxylicivirga marina TaxID=2800988 RepID=A0ABS1HF71_9BACT|nr:hypothetical protein [Carboxylicivirga marina]MBK3516325.1 hypothetical protein [Carboxylicivirga marina]
MWGKHQMAGVKRLFFIRADEYEIQNLVLIHMLHITFFLSLFSAFTNPFLGLPLSVIYVNFLAFVLIVFNYWLVRVKKKYKQGRFFYLSFVILMLNFLWLETGGSTGPTLFYILAFVPMFIFLVDKKRLIIGFIIISINIPILLLIEAYYPELITYYSNNIDRILDILLVCIIFVIFEIPLIIYVKNTIIEVGRYLLNQLKINMIC